MLTVDEAPRGGERYGGCDDDQNNASRGMLAPHSGNDLPHAELAGLELQRRRAMVALADIGLRTRQILQDLGLGEVVVFQKP